ncbi:uncharacterized protein LOC117582439 [Drosophila guanche]|uniref:Blast:Peptidyl-prolyl cis-trans isomerase, rhodopsin-specific isozyme n=1 Tax=Drosophila guanche TaxID=7266 RepID=A0A3B0JZJ8_DROGU|nr:uncharacterized protein LOC117582439 [Drosophila guanche]SPP79109.1 blast:Peptidyl-prolyl cis-trans isomerase%2C rhodopsin-specific isozyme [Drosophila guanche]
MSDIEIHHVANEASAPQEDEDVEQGESRKGSEVPKPSAKLKSKTNFCCIAKEYYSDYTNLVDSLHIMPRLMIHQRGFKINNTYGLTLNIRNSGLYPRLIRVSTDSRVDTSISIVEADLHRYLATDQLLEVKIWIRAKSWRDINRRRHIYIESYHPNIIFQVPIIVLHKLEEPSLCEFISLPRCVPNNKSYYEMIIYNPTEERIRMRFRNTNRGLTLNTLNKDLLPPKDYIKVLLVFHAEKLQSLKGFFNIKFGVMAPKMIIFDFLAKSMGVHLSGGTVPFGLTKFSREERRTVTVCNESSHEVMMSGTFDSDQRDVESATHSVASHFSNKLIDEAVSMHSVLIYDFEEDSNIQNVNYNATAPKHFGFVVPHSIPALSAAEIVINFRPLYDSNEPFSDDAEPPYFQRTRLIFCFTDAEECMESHFVVVSGEISGIEVELYPKVIDFRKIYLGEEHCAQIKILNVDAVPAKVAYKDTLEKDLGGVRVSPIEGLLLEPCCRGAFSLSFYTVHPSRFTITLRFKVVNGAHHKVHIKGTGQHVQLRTFPQLVEFGSIPMAVPQKRYMLLMNPLAVPITLQVTPSDDGAEQPLVLNIRDSTEMLPITVRDPIKHLQRAHEDMRNDSLELTDIKLTSLVPDMLSLKSLHINESAYSMEFEEDVMEPVPLLATHMLTNLKRQKIFDKTETDKRVIQEALHGLLSTKYFSIFTKHNNFIFMDWNALPSDPREVYCDNEIIYLRPNTGRTITILLIPNQVGYFHRSLTVRICPSVLSNSGSSENLQSVKTLIKSDFLCSKLWFEYNCVTPEIEWSHLVDLSSWIVYAGEEYEFDMSFYNRSNTGGFLHFDVIPNEMSFRDGTWKFYIGSGSRIIAKCAVSFRSLGNTRLTGLIKIVGASRPYAFHLFANVLPTEIRITPNYVQRRLQTYELHKVHFYIDNCSPTNTKLTMKLQDTTFQYLTTRGGVLASTGQSMYTTLVAIFPDPDLYQNILYVDLQFDHVMEIPITFLVEGVPLYFEPNIRQGFDAGQLYTDTKEQFQQNVYNHRFPVKVINKGFRTYRITVTRLKTYAQAKGRYSPCASQALTARFDITPKHLYLPSGCEERLEILISSWQEGVVLSDFLLQVTDQKYPQRKYTIKVTAKAEFVECQLVWSRKQLLFEYQSCEPLKQRSNIHTPELINKHALPIAEVRLQVCGPFRIKGLYEDTFEKEILVPIEALQHKDIFVILNRGAMKQFYCKQLEGRISVWALGRQLNPLALKVTVQVPDVLILQPELVVFDRGAPFDCSVSLVNQGCLRAEFKWKRLETAEQFVGDNDDPQDLVADFLSELLRMLEYNFSCEDEPNMTLRYQQCRCQFSQQSDTAELVLELLDELVNDLDLSHRPLVYPREVQSSEDSALELHSTSSFVRATIHDLLERLNVESSEQLSPASSEYCFAERFIYFHEKQGVVELPDVQPEHQCVLHVPHIRRSHELRATFQLTVVGGRSQCLSVTLVNLTQKIKFHKESVYLGIKPWYEQFNAVLRVENVTKYQLQLLVVELTPVHSAEKRLIEGYSTLVSSDLIHLEPLASDQLRLKGVLGFSESFCHTFGVLINGSASSHFWLRGQGVMPMLNADSKLPADHQDELDIVEEYRLLQRIYYYEMFKSITETDAEFSAAAGEEEGFQEDAITEDFSQLSESEEEMSSVRQRQHDTQLFKMVQTYVLVNNNQELPHATILKQLLLGVRYRKRLRDNGELYAKHQQVYQRHQQLHKAGSYKLPPNAKYFTVQPIPCQQQGHILDLGQLKRNTLRRFELQLHFSGPGKLIAAARTAVRIPGLFVDFSISPDQHADKKLSFWSEQCTTLEYFKKKYRNMLERLADAQDPTLKHSHSFDLDRLLKHQRTLTGKDRHLMEEYYNSLNPSVYADHKHHFTLAKVYSGSQSNYSGVDVRIVGYFKPETRYYEKDQFVEDYIYIDLHMGPTLPILLLGSIEA